MLCVLGCNFLFEFTSHIPSNHTLTVFAWFVHIRPFLPRLIHCIVSRLFMHVHGSFVCFKNKWASLWYVEFLNIPLH